MNALKENNLKISDIFVIFYYDIFDIKKTSLGSQNVKMHSLCTWVDIIRVIKYKKLYSDYEIQNLDIYLKNPDQWRLKL